MQHARKLNSLDDKHIPVLSADRWKENDWEGICSTAGMETDSMDSL